MLLRVLGYNGENDRCEIFRDTEKNSYLLKFFVKEISDEYPVFIKIYNPTTELALVDYVAREFALRGITKDDKNEIS